MKVLMAPHPSSFGKEESGIRRVVEAYCAHLPAYGVELVAPGAATYDLKAVHAGTAPDADVAHCHGLYFTADYAGDAWEYRANANVIATLRGAKEITVPSAWVAETIQRDMRVQPHVVGHGVDWDEWQNGPECAGHVLWNKNRSGDVCDPEPAAELARRFPRQAFLSTFGPRHNPPANMLLTGVVPHAEMRRLIQQSAVYLATTKETFGIGTLEALAAGVPVLGYAHGGNLDLVQHGVNGYLAAPGNLDDLAVGLEYCRQHRAVLGANGRALARAYTWERVAAQVAGIYQLALHEEPPTVAVIIPAYNYADKVGRAIESATRQTYPLLTAIVVVDDGSTDGGATQAVVAEWAQRDSRVRYLRQNNQGVAHARNNGIASTDTKYICCLDADDALAPPFLERCIAPLEGDRRLGLAYAGLYYIKPDGTEGVSPWPGAASYDAQLRRQNQIPTCCVFRRTMWRRLGGYHQRFAPQGAGSEDAEFWLRAGAYGWGAVQATVEPLFIYSWLSGRVSGNKDYQEVDWLTTWHPWARDGAHPFPSVATPVRFAHQVRQYDQPSVAVIIPVGPGHEHEVTNALDSLEAQDMRRWEAIIIWDSPQPVPEALRAAYPYIRLWSTGGGQGAGAARNLGRQYARAPFLLFLDADDWLFPQALSTMLATWETSGPAIIYSDYVGKALIADPGELAPALQKRILGRDERTTDTTILYEAQEYDCARAQQQPDGTRPYLWCNITSLVPAAWHDEVGGFDEEMPSWEDVDYWYRMARRGKCFVRIAEPLLVYRFYSGGRRDAGVELHQDLCAYMRLKYQEVAKMPCASCGKRKTPAAAPRPYPAQMFRRAATPATEVAVSDSDFVLCYYMHPNAGDHPCYGNAGFSQNIGVKMLRRKGVYFIDYGYRAGGGQEQFLVHRRDVEAAPHLFRPAGTGPTVLAAAIPEVSAPLPIAPEEAPAAPPPAPGPSVPPPVAYRPPAPPADEHSDLQVVPGVTADIAAQFAAADINTLGDLRAETVESLQRFKGVGKKRADLILRGAQHLADQGR